MAFNADKCFVIRAGIKRKPIKQDYTIHNHILEVIEENKYLGYHVLLLFVWGTFVTLCVTVTNIPMWVLPL
jgi:hypothetical protein